VLVVVGTELDGVPRFWDKSNEWYLSQAKAMMVSYAHFHRSSSKKKAAMQRGIHAYLGVSPDMSVYLDNGSFAFWRKGIEPPIYDYTEFVTEAKPDWYPIPADYIPHPQLSKDEQRHLFSKTMEVNLAYASQGFVPIMHAGDWLEGYLEAFERNGLSRCKEIGLGGLVPRLLMSRGSTSRERVIDAIRQVRERFDGHLHIFGIGGLGTLHLAASLAVDSIDSSGWRNRAARGLILLPGRGERSVIPLSSWRGVEVSQEEIQMLEVCPCPACQRYGLIGLRSCNARSNKEGRGIGISGFKIRAIHNLWTLLREAEEVESKMQSKEYNMWYRNHVKSTILLRLIEYALNKSTQTVDKEQLASIVEN